MKFHVTAAYKDQSQVYETIVDGVTNAADAADAAQHQCLRDNLGADAAGGPLTEDDYMLTDVFARPLDASVGFSVEVRAATHAELEAHEATDHANITDGAALVLVSGEVVGIGNEYGTVKLVAGTNHTPTQNEVETFLTAAIDFWATFATPEHDGTEQVRRIQSERVERGTG